MSHLVRFASYEADLTSGQLRKRGARIKLRHQSFQVLASLIEHPGQVVTRAELRHLIWNDEVCVDFENSLNTAVAHLREVLCDSADHPCFVETLPKRGYRFIADVHLVPETTGALVSNRVRVLVLPFADLSGNSGQGYFEDVVTDEIITALAVLEPETMAVVARTTAMHYKGSHKDIARIGRELNVDYVVEGSVRRTGHRIEITVQLVQPSDQTHLFARKYEAALGDIFKMQNPIAQAIAMHIPAVADRFRSGAVGLTRGSQRTATNLAAYTEYIQGRSLTIVSEQNFATARQHLEKAIALDPEFAQAYDALAELYWYLGYLGFTSTRQAFSAGIMHAVRALEIDNTRAETHALLGQFHKTVEYNWSEVHREMALALQLDPNSPLVRMRYAISELMPHGRLDEAAAELGRALESDPLSVWARFWLGIVLVLGRRYEHAIVEAGKVLELEPSCPHAYFVLASCYRCQNKLEEAIAAQRKAAEISGTAIMLGWLGLTLAGSGQVDEARALLKRLHAMAAKGYVPPCSFAWIHLGLRELDDAFEWLNRAVEECDQFMMPIKSYAFFDPLRGDQRFVALLRRMHLEP